MATEAKSRIAELKREIDRAERALEHAERDLTAASDCMSRHAAMRATNKRHEARAADFERQAAELAATIAEVAVAPVAPSEIESARAEVARCQQNVRDAERAETAEALKTKADDLAKKADSATTYAAKVDLYVRKLANEAPAKLLPADAIPGLALAGDEIMLNGVRLDSLSGAEQMRFAVEIAKRAATQANAKVRFLLCDGLERLDLEQYRDFIALATAGGWQLLGTRVASGDLVVELVEASDEPVSAAPDVAAAKESLTISAPGAPAASPPGPEWAAARDLMAMFPKWTVAHEIKNDGSHEWSAKRGQSGQVTIARTVEQLRVQVEQIEFKKLAKRTPAQTKNAARGEDMAAPGAPASAAVA